MSDLARRLWQARLDGSVIEPSEASALKRHDEAYAIQAAIVALSGEPVVGYKVGSTSAEAQKRLDTDEPGAGALLARFVSESPARIAVSPLHHPEIEGEFAFRLGGSLPPRAALYTRAEVSKAIEAVAGAIEVVGTRFKGGLAGKGRLLTTADCGVNVGLALGRWQRDWRSLDLPAHAVSVSVNGAARGHGTGARALGDPVNVMVWLANHLSRGGRGLKAGQIVSTGTCTGLDAVAPGEVAVADFGSLGRVEVAFTAMRGTAKRSD